ncbi:phosphate transport system regulatory protein PhoU [Amycolatopsis acidicola]|uniref:Phosphate transport system regulatory protein PhoU n=1 Tax=Amycolatopsis acidicola TaxID=2596893 RepID=A0A5N0V0C1_9PSEU|nr:PhoU domain-containing protein [Amycolatopsis acidicola]KAA9156199.1 phosphate transport system regulatory protein PhoU [Amycolatopsis acidicola]
MREAFQGELARLGTALRDMALFAADAMRDATTALLTADLDLAQQVLGRDARLDVLRDESEEQAHTLLALQAPVAGDLRVVLAAVHCAEKLERMGDLAAHVAGTTRIAHPGRVVPAELEDSFVELGKITTGMADRVAEFITEPAEGVFPDLERTDESVDEVHARVLARITGPEWSHGAASASTLALVARFYERFGDQAVSVARRVEYAATGSLPRG